MKDESISFYTTSNYVTFFDVLDYYYPYKVWAETSAHFENASPDSHHINPAVVRKIQNW